MNASLLKGNLDLILLIILVDGPRYGLAIIQEANERTGGYFAFKEGSLYPALHRLEKAGWVRGEFAPSDRGGPRRRYYSLTAAGREQLRQKVGEWSEFTRAMQALMGPG